MEDQIEDVKEEVVEETVEDSIRDAIDELAEQEPKEEKPARDEAGKYKKPQKSEEPDLEPKAEKPKSAPPQSYSPAVKAKWDALDPEVQEELIKREQDYHKMLTRNDGELSLGRDLKEVITPYMPIIQAEGGNPKTAIQSLLNTAYQLRTASPERKVQLIQEIATTYGVNLGQVQSAPQLDPAMQQVMNELNAIKSQFTEQRTLQEKEAHANISAEVNAFAADPKHVHFETVREKMGALLGSGQAKDMQEAYDMACWSDPTIRSSLLEAQKVDDLQKKKEEYEKKKQAGSSVKGSPGKKMPSSTPTKSLEDELSDVYDELMG